MKAALFIIVFILACVLSFFVGLMISGLSIKPKFDYNKEKAEAEYFSDYTPASIGEKSKDSENEIKEDKEKREIENFYRYDGTEKSQR